MKSIVKDYFFTKKVLINFLVLFVLSISQRGFAQNVTVTDDEGYVPDDAAMLDVKSTTKGLLVPRVLLVSKDNPISGTKPVGLLVWNTFSGGDYDSTGFYFWKGNDWELISSSSTFDFGNGLTESNGNVLFGGTLQQSTTLNQGNYNLDINLNGTGDFAIQDDGTDVLFVRNDGNVGVGTIAPAQKLDVNGNVRIMDNVLMGGSTGTYGSRVYHNLVSYRNDGWTNGALVIQTNQPMAQCMFQIRITGYVYHENEGLIDIIVGAYSSSAFNHPGYVNLGTFKPEVKLANIGGYIAVIIGNESANFYFPAITVTEYIQSYRNMTESYADGWSVSISDDFSSYTLVTDVPDQTNATSFWSINGDNVYLTDIADNVGIGVVDPSSKLVIQGDAGADDTTAIFEVKNKDGQVVLGVYHEGVRVFFDDQAKGARGGFAVGGFSQNKAPGQEYLRITQDSVRVYINDDVAKASRGGFAVGGFSQNKAPGQEYLRVTQDSVRVYINDDGTKGARGGFAVGGFSQYKTPGQEFLRVTQDSVRIYIKDDGTKGARGGFAVGGFSQYKALPTDFLHVLPDSTRVYVDGDGGFAVDNIAAGTDGRYVDLTPENYFIGHNSGEDNTTGLYNSFFGYQSGMNNISGRNNVFLGYQTGQYNATGFSNIYIGNNAGNKLSNGLYNIYIGDSAGYNNTAFQVCNIFIGPLSGYNNSGSANTFIGSETGKLNTSGGYNTFLGNRAGWKNTNGDYNTFLGNGTGYNNSTGDHNVFIGFYSANDNISGAYNTFIGNSSGYHIVGSRNICIGYQAGYNETGSDKLYIESSNSASPLIYGEFNNDLVTINGDLGVGINPLVDLHVLGDVTSGQLLIAPDVSGSGGDSELLLAEDDVYDYGMSIKYDGGSNYLEVYGKSTTTTYGPHLRIPRNTGLIEMPGIYDNAITSGTGRYVYMTTAGQLGFPSSSLRYKKNITDMEAVDWLYNLRPVNFVYKNDSANIKKYGLIAEEVEKVNSSFVSYSKTGIVETVNYIELITPLLKAIQEQQHKIEELEEQVSEIEALKSELETLKNQIK